MKFDETKLPAQGPPMAVLIIGIGNPLRGDDGVGPAVVGALFDLLHDVPSCHCMAVHQLAPENAGDLALAHHAIFIDASVAIPPGQVRSTRLIADEAGSHTLTHSVAPQTLLWMSEQLFGHAPEAQLIEVGASDLSVGDHLWPAVESAAGRIVRHLSRRLHLSVPTVRETSSP